MRGLAGALAVFVMTPLLLTPLSGGSIEGSVTNRATGAGIEGARVNVWTANAPNDVREVVTGQAGAFIMDNIPDGPYTIVSSKLGFTLGPDLQTLSVQVSGETKLDIPMSPFAKLRGRVLDPDGKPATGVTVKLTNTADSVTDDDGVFVFESVAPGTKTLWAIPEPQAEAKDEMRVVTTYFPSAGEAEQSPAIKVGDTDMFGYEIRLRMARARRVRGVVLSSDGTPVENATVMLYKRPSPTEPIVIVETLPRDRDPLKEEHVVTDDNGGFEFPEVPEGDWLLRAIVLSHDDNNRSVYRNGLVELRVESLDIKDVEIRTKGGFPINVSVDWGDTPPDKLVLDKLPPPRSLASLIPLDGQFLGYFDDAFPGRYTFGRGLAEIPGYYLAAAMLGDYDALGQVVDLSGPTSLRLVYKTGGGSVRGTLENASRAVALLVANGTSTARMGFMAISGDDGGFLIHDVPPGDYTIIAAPVQARSLGSAEIFRQLAANGKRVKIEPGATAQVDLKLAQLR